MKINKAFRELRKIGYFARQNFWCCQSCALYAIPEDKSEKYVFYHKQNGKDKWYGKPFCLSWAGNATEIINIFKNNGIEVEWNGNSDTRLKIAKWEE
jgi:hypothetical protein